MAGNSDKKTKSTKKGPNILCRRYNVSPENVRKLVGILPKTVIPVEQYRETMNKVDGWFGATHQSAEQWGLFYFDDRYYYPRFTYTPNLQEAKDYIYRWIRRFPVTNPYSKFNSDNPNSLILSIVHYMEKNPNEHNLKKIISAILEEPFVCNDIVANAINNYSRVLSIKVIEKDEELFEVNLTKNYKEIIRTDYMDKKTYFDLFSDSNNNQDVHAIEPEQDEVYLNNQEYSYIAAIKTKPFLILGGFSGTGKSQKVKELAFATCPCDGVLNVSETSPGNYLLVSVKPNWHDATDITGFRSSVNKKYYATDFMRFLVKAKLYEDQHIPFFVCLDEMNLAPVEEYFADFLSVIESRKRCDDGKIVTDAIVPASVFNDTEYAADFNIFMKLGLELTNPELKADEVNALSDEEKAQAFVRQDIVEELKREGLTIPSNVIIIGTVNMDDTTNSFSRKVIDRAMTFEAVVGTFDDDYFENDVALNYIKNPRNGELFLSDEVRATQMLEEGRFTLTKKEQTAILGFINGINEDLEGSPFKISYRILNETILLYRSKKRIAEIMEAEGGFEDGVEFDTDLNTIFDDILMQKVLPRIEGDYEKCNKCLTNLSTRAEDNDWLKSSEKIEFMMMRFGTDKSGFTTFWN